MARYCHNCVWREFPLNSMKNYKSVSMYEFSFLNLLQKSIFYQIYNHGIPKIILYKF